MKKRRIVYSIYRERNANRSLAIACSLILRGVCVGYGLLLCAYLVKLAATGPTESHPLSWWMAILVILACTLAGFAVLARYLRHIAQFEIPFEAGRTELLLEAAACFGARCVVDFVTQASGAAHGLDGSFVLVFDGTADKYLCILGMVASLCCMVSILNYCGMLQDDADTIN